MSQWMELMCDGNKYRGYDFYREEEGSVEEWLDDAQESHKKAYKKSH